MAVRRSALRLSDAAINVCRGNVAGCWISVLLGNSASPRCTVSASSRVTEGSTDAARMRSHRSASASAVSASTAPDARTQHRRVASASPQLPPDTVPGPQTTGGRRRTVAVGISGGVDSAVAALLLKRAGHDVVGVFMRNWDERDESGEGCSAEDDFREAQRVARHLRIPLHEADFVAQYWTRVFADFVDLASRGLTPNPDLACNRHIKFDALLRFATDMGADCVATGHYARLRHDPDGGPSQLLTGVDPTKDQSYFLASVPGSALRDVVFPLGGLRKADVRRLAAHEGIPSAHRRSSAGLCFVGRRRHFGEFLAQYAPPLEGTFVDVDDPSRPLERCPNVLALTHGQRAGIGGAADRMYVIGKDMPARKVFVVAGRDHPALYTRSALLHGPSWVACAPPPQLTQGSEMAVTYKARYGQPAAACTIGVPSQPAHHESDTHGTAPGHTGFAASAFWRPLHAESASGDDAAGELLVALPDPARAITPQQEFVMYDGEVCLGAAPVSAPGLSLHELGEDLPPGYVFRDTIHRTPASQLPVSPVHEAPILNQGRDPVMRTAVHRARSLQSA